MERYNVKSRNALLPALAILIILILITGITFAWLTTVLNGTKVNRIKAGTLDLVLDDNTSDGINLEYAIPQTDSQGLNNTPYTFKVINNGTINAEYKLYLEDEEIDGEKLSDENIKYSLTKNSKTVGKQLLSNTITNEKREIENTIITGGSTNNYELKLWIDSEAKKEEIANKVFKAKIKLEAVQTEDSLYNKHIKAVYTYNENGTGTGVNYTGCLGGEEAGCIQVNNITETTEYPTGTVVKYEVKPGVEKYFNVLYDNGDTLTLQQSENTIDSIAWYSGGDDTSNGPITVLPALEAATSDWKYVNNQTYTAGQTIFGTGDFATANTGCNWSRGGISNATSCSSKKYSDFTKTNVKARIITAQEAAEMNCITYVANTCKRFMNNYLNNSTANGGSINKINNGYWTMTARVDYPIDALIVFNYGAIHSHGTHYSVYGARAVVVINK